jgi:hypothetical protein
MRNRPSIQKNSRTGRSNMAGDGVLRTGATWRVMAFCEVACNNPGSDAGFQSNVRTHRPRSVVG